MNIDLFNKNGERVTYVVMPHSFIYGEDIKIGKCLFKLNDEGIYITDDEPYLMFLCDREPKNE